MHIFSLNFKADSVNEFLRKPEARQEAIKALRDLSITKVYIESYRTKLFIENELLRTIKSDFESAGFEVCGCIVPTRMSKRTAVGWDTVTCFTDESARAFMREVIERTAAIFDTILFDDFLFTSCTCGYCKAARGDKTWGEYRSALMLDIVRESIIKPARAVNTNVKLIIKYPCWYDGYFSCGYDVLRETDLFDQTWAGTETRDPDSVAAGHMPQYKAFWLQNWINALGKCGGGWYDPLDCSPQTFVEQARNTILGGARESLLHCYDYLFLGHLSQAKDGGALNIVKNNLSAMAFTKESTGLQKLADTLENMTIYGVAAPKKPNCDQTEDACLHGYFGMLGIPLTATTSLAEPMESCLSAHAAGFENIGEYIGRLLASKTPFLITQKTVELIIAGKITVSNAILKAYQDNREKGAFPIKISDNAHLLRFDNPWDLMSLEQLDALRNSLLENFGLQFYAPSRVGLNLFRDRTRHVEVIQNFNDFPIETRLKITRKEDATRVKLLSLPDNESATLTTMVGNEYAISIKARSLVALD